MQTQTLRKQALLRSRSLDHVSELLLDSSEAVVPHSPGHAARIRSETEHWWGHKDGDRDDAFRPVLHDYDHARMISEFYEENVADGLDRPLLKSPEDPPSSEEQFGSPAWSTVLNPLSTVPSTSIKAAVFSLVASMVGGGTLSVPYAFQEAGVVGGMLLMIVVGAISVYSCGLLVECTRHCPKKHPSFAELAGEAFGVWGTRIVNAMLFLTIFVAIIAYLVLQGDLLPSIMMFFTSSGGDVVWTNRSYLMGLISLLLVPVASAPELKSLRFSSLVSLISIYFLACIIVYKCISGNLAHEVWNSDAVVLFKFEGSFFLAASLLAVSFFCQFNLLPVHFEVYRPTRRKVDKLIFRSMLLVAVVYVLVGIAGYLSFPGLVQGNILKNYPSNDILVSVGRVCLAITLLCGLPLIVHPCRVILDKNLFPQSDYSFIRSLFLSLLILSSACVVAVFVPNIVVIWSFLGSTLCCCIAFVLPPAIYLKLRRRRICYDLETVKAFALLVTGCVLCVVCTIESVINAS